MNRLRMHYTVFLAATLSAVLAATLCTASPRHGSGMSDSAKAGAPTADSDPYKLVEAIDALYSSAWNRLTMYVTVALLVSGIVVPLLAQSWQRSLLRADEARLKTHMQTTIDAASASLTETIAKEVEKARADLRSDMRKMSRDLRERQAHAAAGIYLVQARSAQDRGALREAIVSHAWSVMNAVRSSDDALVTSCIENLVRALAVPAATPLKTDLEIRTCVARVIRSLREGKNRRTHDAAIEAFMRSMKLPDGAVIMPLPPRGA